MNSESGNNGDALLLSAAKAAGLLGVSRSLFYGLHSSGRLGPLPIKLGSRSLWRRAELAEWVRAGCPGREQWQRKKNEKLAKEGVDNP